MKKGRRQAPLLPAEARSAEQAGPVADTAHL
jgi:hypothetical protein